MRLLDEVRARMRTRHLSPATEEAYVAWSRRFMVFHDRRHPKEMAEREVGAFLTHLAVDAHVSASTQQRIPQQIDPRRLYATRKRDIDMLLMGEGYQPWQAADYRELAMLARAVATVVVSANGVRDSLDVTVIVHASRSIRSDTLRFRAASPDDAVDSLVARLLTDPRFHRKPE